MRLKPPLKKGLGYLAVIIVVAVFGRDFAAQALAAMGAFTGTM